VVAGILRQIAGAHIAFDRSPIPTSRARVPLEHVVGCWMPSGTVVWQQFFHLFVFGNGRNHRRTRWWRHVTGILQRPTARRDAFTIVCRHSFELLNRPITHCCIVRMNLMLLLLLVVLAVGYGFRRHASTVSIALPTHHFRRILRYLANRCLLQLYLRMPSFLLALLLHIFFVDRSAQCAFGTVLVHILVRALLACPVLPLLGGHGCSR